MMEPRKISHFGFPTAPETDPHLLRKRSLSPEAMPKFSRSEPHFDLPHLHITRESCSPMSRVLSGLFEVDSALNTPLNRSRSNLASSNSSAGLSQLDAAGSGGGHGNNNFLAPTSALRKSNSAVDWTSSGLVSNQSNAMSTSTAAQSQSGTNSGGAFSHLIKDDRGLANSSSTSALHNPMQPHSGKWGNSLLAFFAKPVERTEQETYRYLMALDR